MELVPRPHLVHVSLSVLCAVLKAICAGSGLGLGLNAPLLLVKVCGTMKGQEGGNAQSEGHTLAPHGCSFVQGVKFSVQTVSRGRAAYRSKEEDRLPR